MDANIAVQTYRKTKTEGNIEDASSTQLITSLF